MKDRARGVALMGRTKRGKRNSKMSAKAVAVECASDTTCEICNVCECYVLDLECHDCLGKRPLPDVIDPAPAASTKSPRRAVANALSPHQWLKPAFLLYTDGRRVSNGTEHYYKIAVAERNRRWPVRRRLRRKNPTEPPLPQSPQMLLTVTPEGLDRLERLIEQIELFEKEAGLS